GHPRHSHREVDAMSVDLRNVGSSPDVAGCESRRGALVAVDGVLESLPPAAERVLFERGSTSDPTVVATVSSIIADVRARGDAALREMAERFDKVQGASLEGPREAWDRARRSLDPDVRAALEEAARAIASFHRAQMPRDLELENLPGVRLGRRADPLDRVGVYAPGGRATYPSSVIMGVVPARVAGVREVIVCSPPGRNGLPAPAVLAAAELAGADRVFAIGGAGAIAAMAYGTESLTRVDRIVGPGNAYVAEAKRQCSSVVGIDTPAGPSELLVIADSSSNPAIVAQELLAQAEHDPMAAVAAVVVGEETALEVEAAVLRLLPTQARREIIAAALRANSALLLAADLSEAVEFASAYAPEHLLLAVADADASALLARVRNAGTVFLGETSSVSFGDYMTGANAVLATVRMARSCSRLSTLDFVRWTSYQRVTREVAAGLAEDVAILAGAEMLPGHADAARQWGGA